MSVGQKMRSLNRSYGRFIRIRMWINTLMSYFYNDNQMLLEDLGNDVLITNNQIMTINSLTSYILIERLSWETPVGFCSYIIDNVRTQTPGVRVDVTFKNQPYTPDIKGLVSRYEQWDKVIHNKKARRRDIVKATALMYTADVLRKLCKVYKCRLYIKLRATSGNELRSAQEVVFGELNAIDAEYRLITSNMEDHVYFSSIISNKKPNDLKAYPYMVVTNKVLSQLLPRSQGLNLDKGQLLGTDRSNNSPYFEDFKASANGKNIIISGTAGSGKTELVKFWEPDFYVSGFNICIMDLKGNEHTKFAESVGGHIISFRSTSTYYVNTFKLRKEYLGDQQPSIFYAEQFELSKEKLLKLINMGDAPSVFIDRFLKNVYLKLGVIGSNPNTWYRSLVLDMYTVYDMLLEFINNETYLEFGPDVDKYVSRLETYINRNGSNAHRFKNELNYHEILKSKCIVFDLGYLGSGVSQDVALLNVSLLDMRIINKEYVALKKSLGEWVFKVDEEAQIAGSDLKYVYMEDFVLRRAQNQVTVLLTNSILTLKEDPDFRAVLDNTTMLGVGSMTESTKRFLEEEYHLDKYDEELNNVIDNPDYEYTFVFINKLRKKSAPAYLKYYAPKDVIDGEYYKVVDTQAS